jgi:hypothetical protein
MKHYRIVRFELRLFNVPHPEEGTLDTHFRDGWRGRGGRVKTAVLKVVSNKDILLGSTNARTEK